MSRSSLLALLLLANFLGRLPFFLFKYTGVFYFELLGGTADDGRRALAWTLGLAYIAPILWSGKINTPRRHILAVSFGGILLFLSFVALYAQSSSILSACLFIAGFGLMNSNFKAAFGSSLARSDRRLGWEFTLLLLSTNLAAAVAGFVAPNPQKTHLSELSNVFLNCSLAMVMFGGVWALWWFCTRGVETSAKPMPNSRLAGNRGALDYSTQQLLAVAFVIFLATVFWVGFELRPLALNQLARDRLSPTTWGLPITASHLQSVNPIAFVLLAPLFACILKALQAKQTTPHPFYFMGAGAAVLGSGLLIFSYITSASGNAPLGAELFILLYIGQTIGELLIEPLGLDFLNRNSPTRLKTLLFVLWECNSGIAYLIGGYVPPGAVGGVGLSALLGGLAFMLLTPWLKRFVQ